MCRKARHGFRSEPLTPFFVSGNLFRNAPVAVSDLTQISIYSPYLD